MAAAETTQPFYCLDAIEKLCKRSRRKSKPIKEICESVLDVPVLSLIKENFSGIYQLSTKSGIRIVIMSKQISRNKLLIDFRHMESSDFLDDSHPVVYWLIDKTSLALILETTDPNDLPKNNRLVSNLKNQVLPIFSDGREPQTLQELKDELSNQKIQVFYEVCSAPYVEAPWLVDYDMGYENTIVAFARPDLSIGYKVQSKKNKIKPTKMPKWMSDIKEEKPPPELINANRRSSVSVKLKGLNCAKSLGLISQEEMLQLSQALAGTAGAIWLTHDEENHVRHILYNDAQNANVRMEIPCENNDREWNKFFDQVEKAGEKMQRNKKNILAALMARLEPVVRAGATSPWQNCFNQLKLIIKKHKIFTFCDDDSSLHAIKGPLSGWSLAKKGIHYSKGVYLGTLANYTVTTLSNPDFTIINLSNYFNYRISLFKIHDDDSVLWDLANQWLDGHGKEPLPVPHIKHKTKTLHHHARVNGVAAKTYLADRGLRNVEIILKLWSALSVHYVVNFQVDITSVLNFSLSQIAFTIVWTQYMKESGPMCHAIEQMHSHTEYMLRPWCNGGFSYSCQDEVIQGKPLGPDMEIANSIKELDLTSSYGFSGKSMASGCGFGVIFTPETGRLGQRHFSFEYMAVMYTLYKWTFVQKKSIISVYSNFSPLGTLNVGKYPIDLVVVFQDGTIELVQFDGFYVHGDYNNACLSVAGQFVDGQTRAQVEEKTKKRDEVILNWMVRASQVNMKYSIITDCCHLEYTRNNLRHAFATIPELIRLISGMDKLDGSLDCIDPNEFMFLAIVEGECLQKPFGPMGPIFTTDLSQPTKSSGRMLLTSDYYNYLKPFRVDKIEWIVYYKRCKVLPRVFEKLLQLRQDSVNIKSKAGIVKSIINYACGYFGLNNDKGLKTKARITDRLPHKYNLYVHQIEPMKDYCNGKDLIMIKTLGKPPMKNYMCSTPFTLFVGIVEYGKLRLNQALQCLQKHLRPTSLRLLYSNVDNLIIALSTDSFEEAVQNTSLLNFQQEWNCFIGTEPGQLKLEWELLQDTEWKFVSPARMYYSAIALKKENTSFYKTCSFKGLGSERSYELAKKLLRKESVQVEQVRRIDKLVGTETKPVLLNF